MRFLLLLLAVLVPAPGFAQPRPDVGAAHMSYAAYAVGLRVLDVDAALMLQPAGYRVEVATRTVGVLSAIMRGQQRSFVEGLWGADRAVPRRFRSWGEMRGRAREIAIDYENGQPVVRALMPPNDEEREEVPVPARRGTIDALSALAFLIRQVAETGRCDGAARIYDGRRLTEIDARTAGTEMLARDEDSVFQGTALRCDFSGRQLGGFLIEGDQAWAREPHGGVAWFARVVAGAPPLPVRMTFAMRWFGDATLRLTGAGAGATPSPPVAGR
jgi:hypothetical protein